MTCIAAVAHEGRVYMGGDSAGISGYGLTVHTQPKVFEKSGYLFGFTSSFRMGQLLRHGFEPPRRRSPGDLHRFLCVEFVDVLRSCLSAGGFASAKEGEPESGGTFLLGAEGRLFAVWDDYQVSESADGYDAAGSGKDAALGSLFTSWRMRPESRVRLALEASMRHNAGVRNPFSYLSL